MYQQWIGIPTLACSTLSAVATGLVMMMWFVSRGEDKYTFRYMLVLNLTLAELINSWNNTVSGFIVVSTQSWLEPGITCRLNGWIGQVSVQAADFSVLAIAIVTLLTVRFNKWIINSNLVQQRAVCVGIWVIPITTATTALLMDKMEPVVGNWCWIAREPLYLRYALGHGWRMAIFVVVVASYVAVFADVNRRLQQRRASPTLSRSYSFGMYTDSASDVNASMVHNELIRGKQTMPTTVREAVTRAASCDRNRGTGLEAAQEAKVSAQKRLGVKPRVRVYQSSSLDHDTRHWLLMSLWPLAYIAVWIPGMANRAAELATGSAPMWLAAMQATTQLTGFVNALVYGLKEQKDMRTRRGEARARTTQKWLDLES